ncbi:MAG: DUF1850 domain-containing protein [Ramlibacter sp.]|nr:DUF1850 domain-containing protein [Ramlibacter sp.]MBX3659901.1 DUF1850 domain-containing protein [Ramlibacter sp.]MCW5651033.1 DUF1850 domain-containing protein [Ramlibacter sp.]
MALAGVCLALAAALAGGPAPAPVFVPVQRFTLAWTHSIEKIRWEEDYAVDRASSPRLRATAARIHGSGAGMEPPDDAVLRNGWYEYTPTTPPLQVLRLTRSPYTADYDWCVGGRCQPLSRLLPSDGGVTLLWPCDDPRGGAAQAGQGAVKPGG